MQWEVLKRESLSEVRHPLFEERIERQHLIEGSVRHQTPGRVHSSKTFAWKIGLVLFEFLR